MRPAGLTTTRGAVDGAGHSEGIPVFCIRYQRDDMACSKPLRLVDVRGNVLCAGRPIVLEEDQHCRVLLYCRSPAYSVWCEAQVCSPPSPFQHGKTLKGLRLTAHGLFLVSDYLEAVSRALLRYFGSFERYRIFTPEDCYQLARCCGTRELQKKEILYKAGQRDPDMNDLFMVTGGTLKAYKHDPTDPADSIAALGMGQMLGEMSLVSNEAHTASIAAVVHAWLIQFSRTGLHALEQTQPALFIKIYKLIAQTLVARLNRTTRRWKADGD